MYCNRFVPYSAPQGGGSIAFALDGELTLSRAFECGDEPLLILDIPRSAGAHDVYFEVKDAHTGGVLAFPMEWTGLKGSFDQYGINVSHPVTHEGLYFFRFFFFTFDGQKIYAAREFGNRVGFTEDSGAPFAFQLSFSDFRYKAPHSLNGGIIYHIFVDRFRRGGEVPIREDAIMNEDWYGGIPQYPERPGAHLENNMFFGGTLYGIIEKLEYLKSLNVGAIYLSPVFKAYSNHKYDTGDYLTVDEMFGGDKALDLLIEKAGEAGIRIILDGVFNHTGDDSIYFNKYSKYPSVGAYNSKKSPYYDWYEFIRYPDEYSCWWGIKILPRIHPDRPSCRKFFVGRDGVIAHYAKKGIWGFRLDVVDELSDSFVSDIKRTLNRYDKRSVLYGEVWEDASNKVAYDKRKRYYLGEELDGVMNYPLRSGIIEYIRDKKTDKLVYALTEVMPNMPKRIRNGQMNLLGTHDTVRILTALGGDSANGVSNSVLAITRMSSDKYDAACKMLKCAYMILSAVPGIPTVYYGDEAGMQGYSDPFNRMPFPWGRENTDLLEFFRKLNAFRRGKRAFVFGEFRILELTPEILIFERRYGKYSYITAVNNSNSECCFTFGKSIKIEISTQKLKSGTSISLGGSEAFIVKTETEDNFVNYILKSRQKHN